MVPTVVRFTYAGIKGITWHEDKDKPCKMVVDAKESASGLTYDDSKTAAVIEDGPFEICIGSPGNVKSVILSNSEYFVRGIQIGTTDRNTVTITGSRVSGCISLKSKIEWIGHGTQ